MLRGGGMSLKERYCKIRESGCKTRFIPARYWQEVCDNPLCQQENRRRNTKFWRKQHPGYHKDYMKKYYGREEAVAR